MKINLLAFGIAKEIIGTRFLEVELTGSPDVSVLRAKLVEQYPRLAELVHVRLAVNNEYAEDGILLSENDEVALIPPVSGG